MLMFSATFSPAAREIADTYMSYDHCRITVGRAGFSHASIQQSIIWVEGRQKREALVDLMRTIPSCRTLIFVNSRSICDELDDYHRNSDMGTSIVEQLIEMKQHVPDFLKEYRPQPKYDAQDGGDGGRQEQDLMDPEYAADTANGAFSESVSASSENPYSHGGSGALPKVEEIGGW